MGTVRRRNCDPTLVPAITDVGTIRRGHYDGNLPPISTAIASPRLNM